MPKIIGLTSEEAKLRLEKNGRNVILIFAIVLISGLSGFFQEYKVGKSIENQY